MSRTRDRSGDRSTMRTRGVAAGLVAVLIAGCSTGRDTDAADTSPTFHQLSDDSLHYEEPISLVSDLLAPVADGDPWRVVGSVVDPGTGRTEAAVWSATTAPDWEQQELEAADADISEAMAAVTPFGESLLAVGRVGDGEATDAAVWQADGDTWTRLTPPELGGRHKQWAFDVTAGEGGALVAGGESAWGDVRPRLWFSSDGETWSSVDGGPGGPLDVTGEESVRAVTPYGTGFVAVGTRDLEGEQDGAVWFSRDGTTWEQVDVPQMGGPGRQSVLAAGTADNGIVVAGGYVADGSGQGKPAIWNSRDGGQTWSDPTILPLHEGNRTTAGDLAVHSLSVRGSRVVASGGNDWIPHMWDTGSGSWRLLPSPVREDLFADGVELIDAALDPDNALLAIGDTPTVLSFNGSRWTDATGDSFPSGGNRPQATSVLLADDTLFAAGFNFTSARGSERERYTGRVWQRGGTGLSMVGPDEERPDLGAGKINDLATFDGGYVAVGFEDFSFAGERTAQPGADLPDGLLWTSEDGAAWVRQFAQVQAPDAGPISIIDADPTAAATAATNIAAGQPWVSTEPAGGPGTRALEAVVDLGSGYMAVGSVFGDNDRDGNTPDDTDALVVVSADGAAMTGEDPNLKGPGTQRLRDVCRNGDNVVVAVGSSNGDTAVRRRGADGAWAEGTATDDSFGGVGTQEALGCAASADGFIAVGTDNGSGNTNGRVWTSTDGLEWEELTAGVLGGAGEQQASAVAAVPGTGWLVAGTDTSSGDSDVALWRVSADGHISRRDRGEPSLSGPGDQTVESVTVDGEHAVIVGQDPTGIGIWESRNLDR